MTKDDALCLGACSLNPSSSSTAIVFEGSRFTECLLSSCVPILALASMRGHRTHLPGSHLSGGHPEGGVPTHWLTINKRKRLAAEAPPHS